MKLIQANELCKIYLLASTLFLFTIIIPLCLFNSSTISFSPKLNIANNNSKISFELGRKCDVFSGKWVPYPQSPYYTNETCHLIFDRQNCLKFGRSDREFLKWRWQPDECHLPLFDAALFLEIARGKSIAFVGDSVGRNQMESLLCLLTSVVYPEDISLNYSTDTKFKRYLYKDYNLTIAGFYSPFLVKASDADPDGHSLTSIMRLDLDEADAAWATQIEHFDYVIISAGQWFFRPMIYYENDQVVGCHICGAENITALTKYYGYKMAFRSAFKALQRLNMYKGMTILRTFSPEHFENGEWNRGGACARTRPQQMIKLDGHILEFYLTQVEELRAAERMGRKRGLRFGLLDTTEAMLKRPDGHPNRHSPDKNMTVADCVHWCLPGPIDTWNEWLLYMLKLESTITVDENKRQKNAS